VLIDADFGTQIRVCHSRGGCGLRAAGLQPAAAEGTAARLEKAVAVLNKLTDSSGDGIRPEEIASADCVAVIPGFYKGAAVVGVVFEADLLLEVSFGRGFIACRNGDNWSAPAAITMEPEVWAYRSAKTSTL